MWMGTEDKAGEQSTMSQPPTPQTTELTPLGASSNDSGRVSMPLSSDHSGSAFTAPSPMQYDYQMSPGVQSPGGGTVPLGPSSHNSVDYPPQSPGAFYNEYNNHQQQMQHQYGGYSTGFQNGGYEDSQFGKAMNHQHQMPQPPRYHPYMPNMPRISQPTPSPGTGQLEIKEENVTQDSTDILDLDSQKVLGQQQAQQHGMQHHSMGQNGPLPSMHPHHLGPPSPMPQHHLGPPSPMPPSPMPSPVPQQQSGPLPSMHQSHSGPLPPMWRPHEQFPTPSGMAEQAPSGMPPMHQMGYPSHPQQHPSHPQQHPSHPQQHPSHPQQSPNAPHYGSMMPGTIFHTGPAPGGGFPHQRMGPTPPPLTSPGMGNMYGHAAPPPSSPHDSVSSSDYAANLKRSKSFKCEDCNKWFTSNGHLKRHFNTTLHKNMSKLNGANASSNTTSIKPQSDTVIMPIMSPGARSIMSESSMMSGLDEESNLSSSDALEPPTPPPTHPPQQFTYGMLPTSLANNIEPPTSISNGIQIPSSVPNGLHSSLSGGPQPHTTLSNGMHQLTSVSSAQPFFREGQDINFESYQLPGGLSGPGFHSIGDFPGAPSNGLDIFSHVKIENSHVKIEEEDVKSHSPDLIQDDIVSENSLDSSESLSNQSLSHSLSTAPIDNFACQDCGKTFNRVCYLTQHRSTYHEGEKPFKCGTCGKRFPDEITFSDHQSKHAGEKPYKCTVCPKQFNHKTDLRRHMFLHSGEKPFSCEQCGKGFIRKDHMLKHYQTHLKKAMGSTGGVSQPGSQMIQGFPGQLRHPGVPTMGHHVPPGYNVHPGHPSHFVAPPVNI
ncbi:unnamed protein product, partial [Meganyctiphanes norvegica]